MGGSGKWLKSLIGHKKPLTNDQDKMGDKTKKRWSLWRSASEGCASSSSNVLRGHVAASEASDYSSFMVDDDFIAAMATVVRAPHKDFLVVKQEWAAIRIQTAFRGLLARRALRALKAVVRLQALFRGRKVRKQAAVTLRCMQALVRVQERMRSRNVIISSSEGQAVQQFLDEYCNEDEPTKPVQHKWCDCPGTVDEVRAKLQMRQEGAMKRERAIAYFLSHQQQSRSCVSPNPSKSKATSSLKNKKLDNSNPDWSWLDGWMAVKSWESRPMEKLNSNPSEMTTPYPRKSDDHIVGYHSYASQNDSVKVRRNNVTTKVSARPPITTSPCSAPSSESQNDEKSTSTLSTSISPIPVSGNTLIVESEDSSNRKPSYMSLTESTKAKLKSCRDFSHDKQRHLMEDFQSHKKLVSLSSGDTRSSAGSDPSVLCKDLYPPIPLGRHDWVRN
ncbi:IQ domain-containing protein [Cephalotus follicularis]|uniref:IQ domain-containing protein n=1 Tax=Cephalotus follicularis TaxID=3775 RepID=A0A1Q3CXE9_CEPFO|nr:IQ domain-containing protein [Cephalotus follicularis]